MSRKPISGVRHLLCENCKHTWKEHSRDVCSMSDINCPNCLSSDTDTFNVTEDEVWTQDINTSNAARKEGLI